MSGQIVEGASITGPVEVDCDVCIVGSGAGGAVLAAGLTARGLSVVMLEEGPSVSRKDFSLREADAFPMLYQERGTRATADLAITILQGRSVGGSTTVNWTTCFRTPERILAHWAEHHGVSWLDPAVLAPHFEAVEARLGIAAWPEALVNPNNATLLRGCRALGYEASVLSRNVRGCANSGYCGLGCPVDGKQAMHLTYLPDAVAAGLRLYADVRAERIEVRDGRAVAVHGEALDRHSGRPLGFSVKVRARKIVASGGAINTPALLLRSGIDQGGLVGRRTFLHPVVSVMGVYPERIAPWQGAPQSVGSHHFIDRGADKIGFFLETPPIQPMLAATAMSAFGTSEADFMGKLPHLSGYLALSVDGLLPGDDGGVVSLRADGRVRVDYPIRPALAEAFHAAHVEMTRIHRAAGASAVHTLMVRPPERLEGEAPDAWLDRARYGAHEHSIFTAHQMGGCPMGDDPKRHVVDRELRVRGVEGLHVVDGSVLPTALGVNPSQTIYGLARWATEAVAADLG